MTCVALPSRLFSWEQATDHRSEPGHRKRFHPDPLATLIVAALFGQEDEAVALHHRAQDSRALWTGGGHFPAAFRIGQDAALKFHHAGALTDGLPQAGMKACRLPS